MRRVLLTVLAMFFMASAYAAAPTVTVQIADTRDTAGIFTTWTTLASVVWDSTSLSVIPDPSAVDRDYTQDWFVPEGHVFWHFSFKRTKQGEYALRYCFGMATVDSIWSDVAVVCIVRPPAPRH
ncbi:MAG: hypothetical protein Q8Q12_21595 [bacterium]|nr:hypothetical protein [bacterium]